MGHRKTKPPELPKEVIQTSDSRGKKTKRTWKEQEEDKRLALHVIDEAQHYAKKIGVAWIKVSYPEGWPSWQARIYYTRFQALKGFLKELVGWREWGD
jgi:hypothetical protein